MEIEIRELFNAPGMTLPVSGEIDLSGEELWGVKPLKTPVHISGEFQNRSGIISLKYSAEYLLEYECDRCRRDVRKTESRVFEHWLAKELAGDNEDDAYILVPTGILQMDELVMTDVTLELPFQLLCREDCKGLCPVCGADLNETSCQCDKKQIDPRLESLRKLLDS